MADQNIEIAASMPSQLKPKSIKEVFSQDNIFEIEMNVDSDVEGGIDIENDCIYGNLLFL